MLPDQFLRIQLRRVCRETFRGDLRMTRQIGADNTCTIMDVASIPDDCQRAADMLVKLAQETHRVVGAGVCVVAQQRHKQVETLLSGTDRDRTDGRNSVVPVPRPQDRRFTARRIGPPHSGIEQVSGFVEERQRGPSVLGFFLYAGILPASSVRFRLHRAPAPGIRAFDRSNVRVGSLFSARGLHDTEPQRTFESGAPRASKSTIRWANRAPLRPGPRDIPIHEAALHPSGEVRRDAQWQASRQVHYAPWYASGRASHDPRRESRRSWYGIGRHPSIRRRGYGVVGVLLLCRVVSCIYYRHLIVAALTTRGSIGDTSSSILPFYAPMFS